MRHENVTHSQGKQSIETDLEIAQMLDLPINLVVIGILGEANENGEKKLFEDVMAKNFPKLDKNLQTQAYHRKMVKTKDTEKFFKIFQKKNRYIPQGKQC